MESDHKKNLETLHSGQAEWNVSDRIKEIIGDRSVRKAASDWGVSFGAVNNWLKGAMPALDTIADISRKEGVSLEWIAYGEKPTHLAEQKAPIPQPEVPADEQEEIIRIPAYEVEAAAGAGSWIAEENMAGHWYVPRSWLHLERLEHANLCIINTIGDSMAPNIRHGDRLLVKSNINRDMGLNGVFVINLDGQLRVKRLEASMFPHGYRVISDNELYPEEFIPASELQERMYVIGEVVRVFGAPASQPASQPAKHQSEELTTKKNS